MAGIFKAYDIRGTVPDQIDEAIAERIGRAIALHLGAKHMAVGRDMRASGVGLTAALERGIMSTGCNVTNIGVVSTPMQYFAVGSLETDGGVMVTASHNPAAYNGFKISAKGCVPVGGGSGLPAIEQMVMDMGMEEVQAPEGVTPGTRAETSISEAYTARILELIGSIDRPLKVAVDCGNGMGGVEVDHVLTRLPIDMIGLYLEPDGTFPNHEANPLNPANMADVCRTVVEQGCDIGIAFDGDADRACFCDETGRIIPNDLVTAMLAGVLLPKEPGGAVVYDLRSSRVVPETIKACGGNPVRERVGHAFMKATLRSHEGPYGGELSGHFYFRDLWYTDSGALAAGLVMRLLAAQEGPLSGLVDHLRRYPNSGEVNFEVEDKDGTIERVAAAFPDARQDRLDGITIEYDEWWCNVRKSNTEPLLRLTLEANDQETFDRAYASVVEFLGTPAAGH